MSPKQLERTFNYLMLEGRVHLSMRLLTKHCVKDLDLGEEANGNMGPLNKSV